MGIDLKNKQGFIVLGLLSLFLFGIIHWDGEIFQYLFFLRVPLIAGLLLVFLPIICIYWVPAMLGNLFVLNNPLRMAWMIPGTIAAGLGIVLIGSVIGAYADERFHVTAYSWLEKLASEQSIVQYIIAILLSLPTILAIYWSSGPASGEMSNESRRNGTILGVLLSLFFLAAVYWVRENSPSFGLAEALMFIFSALPEPAQAGFLIKTPEGLILPNGHEVLGSYLLFLILMYCAGLVLYRPSTKKNAWQLPAIAYVLVLLQIFSLLFGMMTFLFDFYQIPTLLLALLFSALAYHLWKVDHYYEIRKTENGLEPLATDDVVDVLKNRLAGQDTLVVVCASGGGIQAAGWTTMVLTGLQAKLGENFTRAIGLISSVSGGSVGTMYFLDRFNDKGIADPNKLNDIFTASTQDSLGATGWGLAYPDLWRIVGMPYLKTSPRDRGDAIHTDWKSEMNHPCASMRAWGASIRKGLLPIPVFNATIVEDGRHYLISPMTFDLPKEQGIEFNSLYPDCDIDVSTAALLSATFPYVTPIPRNSVEPKDKPIFHVADGGFFDNYGVITAVDWLDRFVLPNHQAIGIKRILLLEIRAFPDEPPTPSAPDESVGWRMALLGPLLAVFSARNSTQNQRNQHRVKDLIRDWKGEGVEVISFPISFPKEIEFFKTPMAGKTKIPNWIAKKRKKDSYKPPLSWTLTKKQREEIHKAWNQLVESKVEELKKIWEK